MEDQLMKDIISGAFIAPLTAAIVWAIRKTELINPKFGGIVSMVVGVVLGLVRAYMMHEDYVMWGLYGLVMGLVATGAFSSIKNTREGMHERSNEPPGDE